MKLLTVFFETYLPLTEAENEQLAKKIERTELEEAAVMEWLTSWEKKGMEKGIEKGMLKSKEEIAAKMLAKGLDPAMVEEMTGLPAERIDELKTSV
ncbi:hypothetical protein [Cohnella sp.]|uniref:hypothetical protein n=1 Tax=Cohnella sp. TaxID=1883426 RepID=UPI00356A944C